MGQGKSGECRVVSMVDSMSDTDGGNKKPAPRDETAPAKRVTLSDVAKLANVSTMTVSKVIRNTGSISTPTRNHVREAIDALGYIPNLIAGSLSSQVNLMVAVIVPAFGDDVFGGVLQGINTVLNGAGMHTLLGASDFHTDIEEELIRTMMAWQPSGLILTGGMAHSASTDKILGSAACPIVQIWDNDVSDFDTNVGFSHVEAGRMMAQHFIAKGYRNIGYIGARHGIDKSSARRYQAFRDELQKSGLSVQAEITASAVNQTEFGVSGTRSLLARSPELDAIHYQNDTMAVGGLTWLHRARIPVPQQIAVAGFDGSFRGRLISTELTTIVIPRSSLGEASARSLLDRIQGKSRSRYHTIEIDLLDGDTTGGSWKYELL